MQNITLPIQLNVHSKVVKLMAKNTTKTFIACGAQNINSLPSARGGARITSTTNLDLHGRYTKTSWILDDTRRGVGECVEPAITLKCADLGFTFIFTQEQ